MGRHVALRWPEKGWAATKARGERFLADWLKKEGVCDADVQKLIQFIEQYRSADFESELRWDTIRVLDAADEILHVVPEGIDDYFTNRIFDMLDDADLKRLRRCLSCGRWLFALHPRQKHCTPQCRDSFRMNTPKYRQRKRENMRKLRKDDKDRRNRAAAYLREQEKQHRVARDKAPGLGNSSDSRRRAT